GVWEDVFNIDNIGITEDFFDLGGHSMLAVRVLVKIKERFGVELSLATIFQSHTIEELADIIRRETSTSRPSILVPIRPSGYKQPPLILVHAMRGDTGCYDRLAHYLGEERPIYGLQGPSLES